MENLGWGLQITALGMGLVFALLVMLWALLTLVLRFDRGAAPAALTQAATPGGASAQDSVDAEAGKDASEAGDELARVAAITAAVLAHSAMRHKEAAPSLRAHWPGSLLHASRWVSSGRLRQNTTFRKRR